MQTLSYLSEADRKAYSDRQSVSFMYQKPPGLDAALSRDGVPPVRATQRLMQMNPHDAVYPANLSDKDIIAVAFPSIEELVCR